MLFVQNQRGKMALMVSKDFSLCFIVLFVDLPQKLRVENVIFFFIVQYLLCMIG